MQQGDVAWQVIEAVRRQEVTGELTLHVSGMGDASPVRVYVRDGVVYLAERGSDPTLGVRLIAQGVVTREQLHRGALMVSGVEHLGRLFEREPSVDRGAVELCVEMFTDAVLADVAGRPVQRHEFAVYRRHPAGVDRWMSDRHATGSIAPTAVVETPTVEVPVVAPPPVEAEALPATFADEVAVAVRAVLEAIDVAANPAPRYVPDEFTWSTTA